MGWFSISPVLFRVVVSIVRDIDLPRLFHEGWFCRPNGGVALNKKELVLLAGAFDPARFPLLWNPWAWLAVLPTLFGSTNMRELGLKIITKQPLGHQHIGRAEVAILLV